MIGETAVQPHLPFCFGYWLLAIGYALRHVSPGPGDFVICHFSLGLRRAIRGFNRFAHDLTAVGYDAGLKDFVV